MPLPAKSQWSGFAQVQGAPPMTGPMLRAPISELSFGAWRGSDFWSGKLLSPTGSGGPKRSRRRRMRFGVPSLPGRNSIRPQQVLPDRNATFRPSAIACLRLWNIGRL